MYIVCLLCNGHRSRLSARHLTLCFPLRPPDGSDEPLGEHACIVEHLVSTRPVSSSPACPVIGLTVIPHPLLMVVLLATHEVGRGMMDRRGMKGKGKERSKATSAKRSLGPERDYVVRGKNGITIEVQKQRVN